MKQIQLKINDKNVIAEVSAFNNKQHVAITPICEAIGVDTASQIRKLKTNPQFTPSHMTGHDSTGRSQEMIMLPIEEIDMWLCNISAAKVKSEVREVLIQFQKHCQVELHAAITGMAGTDIVGALEEQMRFLAKQLITLTEQNQKMVNLIETQQQTINHLSRMVHPMANVEKHIASIGGKFMAVARGTKKMRNDIQ